MSLEAAKQNFQKIVRNTVVPLGAELAEVQEVDITNFTIKATGQKTARFYSDVPFVAVRGEMESIVCIPDVGSYVLIVDMDRNDSFVALTGKLTQIIANAPSIVNNVNTEYEINLKEDEQADENDSELKLTSDGLFLKVADQSFKDAITDLKTAIGQLTVNTPNGPSSVPVNINALNQAFDKILSCLQ